MDGLDALDTSTGEGLRILDSECLPVRQKRRLCFSRLASCLWGVKPGHNIQVEVNRRPMEAAVEERQVTRDTTMYLTREEWRMLLDAARYTDEENNVKNGVLDSRLRHVIDLMEDESSVLYPGEEYGRSRGITLLLNYEEWRALLSAAWYAELDTRTSDETSTIYRLMSDMLNGDPLLYEGRQ